MPIIIGPHFGGVDFFTILTTVFWIWMLVDCILNKKLSGGGKIGWVIFIFLTQIVGAVIYFFLHCTQRNPIEAFRYYYQQFAAASRPTPTPPYAPPQRPATPVYAPPAETYTDYAGGYRAQQPKTVATPAEGFSQEQPLREQPEYEQPIISYPEMPTQQHQ